MTASVAQREEFLEALRQGIPPGLAARAIGFTGTKLRGCRHRDPVFAAECAAAMEEGNEHYRERLRASARTRALDPEGQTRILEIELATHGGAEYAHLRRDRVTFDGRVEHAILLSAAQIEALSEEKPANAPGNARSPLVRGDERMRITLTSTRVYEMDEQRVLHEDGFQPPAPDATDAAKERWLRESFYALCGFERDEDHVDGSYVRLVEEDGDADFEFPVPALSERQESDAA